MSGFEHDRAVLSTAVIIFSDLIAEQVGFRWYATTDAPSTYLQLKQAYINSCITHEPLPVSSLYCDSTIYLSPEINHRFRFWHDLTHVTYEADFTAEGELTVASLQLHEVAKLGEPEFFDGALKLLRADTIGQDRCLREIGRHPADQLRFVQWCLEVGIDEAIAYEAAAGTDEIGPAA